MHILNVSIKDYLPMGQALEKKGIKHMSFFKGIESEVRLLKGNNEYQQQVLDHRGFFDLSFMCILSVAFESLMTKHHNPDFLQDFAW